MNESKELFLFDNRHRISGSWNPNRFLIGGKLTDKAISNYQERGWYTSEFKEARRELMEKKRIKREGKRTGSFIEKKGRLIYSPI